MNISASAPGGGFPWLSVVPPLVTILAAFLAYILGLRAYRAQKEYELVRDRYLTGGIDRFGGHVQQTLAVFRHNWAHALQVVKVFRDIGVEEAGRMCDEGKFLSLDATNLDLTAAYRVRTLVRDTIFWDAHQHLVAFVQSANWFFLYDLGAPLRHAASGNVTINDPNVFYANAQERLKALSEGGRPFYILARAFQHLGHYLERQKLSLTQIDSLNKRPAVQEIVTGLKNAFPEKKEDNQS